MLASVRGRQRGARGGSAAAAVPARGSAEGTAQPCQRRNQPAAPLPGAGGWVLPWFRSGHAAHTWAGECEGCGRGVRRRLVYGRARWGNIPFFFLFFFSSFLSFPSGGRKYYTRRRLAADYYFSRLRGGVVYRLSHPRTAVVFTEAPGKSPSALGGSPRPSFRASD